MKHNWSQHKNNKQRTKFESSKGTSWEEVGDQRGTVIL